MGKIMSKNQSYPSGFRAEVGFIHILFASFISVAEALYPLVQAEINLRNCILFLNSILPKEKGHFITVFYLNLVYEFKL